MLIDTSWVWQQKQDSNFKKTDSTYLKLFTIYKNGSEHNKRAYYENGKLKASFLAEDFEVDNKLLKKDSFVEFDNQGHLQKINLELWTGRN